MSLFIHVSSINIILVLSPRNLLPALALVSLRSQTRSSWLHGRFLLCLLTPRPSARPFLSSFLQQIDQVASTAQVDLDQLPEHLLTVVQETMQPAHVSLWLRPPEHDGKQRAPWRLFSL